jgi:hypothetical protein
MGRPKVNGRRALAGLVAAAVLADPHASRAQAPPSAEDKAAAEASFQAGKRLMEAHAYPEACPKFVESLRRDPGIGTMLGLADCFEHNGQSASAWAEFLEAASAAARKGDRREELARQNAHRLETTLAKVLIRVPTEADVDGLVVKRDGVEVGRAEWGIAVPVDPGIHAVQALATGWKDWQTTIQVQPAPGVQTITVPRLEPIPKAEVTPPPPVESMPTVPSSSGPASDPTAGRRRTQRVVAAAVAGVGVVGIGIGAGFGLAAKSKLDQSNSGGKCDATDHCTRDGLALRQQAESAATVSTILFAVGAAAVAGGAVLWFTAPRRDGGRIGMAPAGAGATLLGAW